MNYKNITFTRKQVEAATIVVIIIIFALACILSSCNVTRTVTTQAQTIQRGDTTVTIMTRTVESYDGSVEAQKLLKK